MKHRETINLRHIRPTFQYAIPELERNIIPNSNCDGTTEVWIAGGLGVGRVGVGRVGVGVRP